MSKEHLIPYKKGESGNYNGRPRKYVSLLKEQGYKVSEINDCIQAMLSMTIEELKAVWDAQEGTILEKTIAGAMRKSLERGSLYSLETLLNRVYGMPRIAVDAVVDQTIIYKANLGDTVIFPVPETSGNTSST